MLEEYKDLEVLGATPRRDAFFAAIEARLPDGWRRAKDYEARIPGGASDLVAFASEERPGRPASSVWCAERGQDIYVSNIVPSDTSSLSYAEYNAILDAFAEIAVGAAETLGLEHRKTSGVLDLAEILSENTYSALKAFSGCANKSTGTAHPNDLERWMVFLVAVHRSGDSLSGHDLGRWLGQQGWEQDQIHELVVQFENGLSLLSFYDGQ